MTDPELELPEGVLEKLRQVSTSTIATQLYKRGSASRSCSGEAVERGGRRVRRRGVHDAVHPDAETSTAGPYRSGNTLQWDAFEALQPGQVLVVDSYRTATAASVGTC